MAEAREAAEQDAQREVECRRGVEEDLAAIRAQLASANTAAEAAKAQLQAYQITAEQKRNALQKERADVEVGRNCSI